MSASTPSTNQPQVAPAPGPRAQGADQPPSAQPTSRPGRGHTAMMVAMCLPMLLLVVVLVATGAVGAGGLLYALGCLVMMGAMMLFMSGAHRH